MTDESSANAQSVIDSRSVAARVMNAALWAYQCGVSPFLGPACRFSPRCSDYARTAIARYGAVKGGWLALKRVLRCHPWNPGGWDPVQ